MEGSCIMDCRKKDLSEYEINRVFDVNTDVWNGMSTAGYPSKLRDPNIKPETEASYEFGTDFRFSTIVWDLIIPSSVACVMIV